MKKQLGLGLVIAILVTGCSVEVPEQVFVEGMEALQRDGNYIYALVQFDKFIANYPTHEYMPTVLLMKARCHAALGENDRAIDALDQVLAGYSGTNKAIEAVYMKADLLEAAGKWAEAAKLLEKLREDLKHYPPAYQHASMLVARVSSRAEQWPEAVAVFDDLIASASIDPRLKPTLYVFKGKTLVDQGETEKAWVVFDRVREQYPGTQEADWALVEWAKLVEEKDPAKAEEYLQSAIEAFRQAAADFVYAASPQINLASPGLQTQGYMGGQPPMSLEEQAEISSELLVVEAYIYVEKYDQAVEVLEELKQRFLHNAEVYQAVMQNLMRIEQLKKQEEEQEGNEQTEAAVSVGSATVGSVSP